MTSFSIWAAKVLDDHISLESRDSSNRLIAFAIDTNRITFSLIATKSVLIARRTRIAVVQHERGEDICQQGPGKTPRGRRTRSVRTGRIRALRPSSCGHCQPKQINAMLESLEESQDVVAFDDALSDAGGHIPWDQVKRDHGWS
jgi:hypothetical protein